MHLALYSYDTLLSVVGVLCCVVSVRAKRQAWLERPQVLVCSTAAVASVAHRCRIIIIIVSTGFAKVV